jgi:hypothetical protein
MAYVQSLLMAATTTSFIHFLTFDPSIFSIQDTVTFAEDGFVLSSAESAASRDIQVIPGPVL